MLDVILSGIGISRRVIKRTISHISVVISIGVCYIVCLLIFLSSHNLLSSINILVSNFSKYRRGIFLSESEQLTI